MTAWTYRSRKTTAPSETARVIMIQHTAQEVNRRRGSDIPFTKVTFPCGRDLFSHRRLGRTKCRRQKRYRPVQKHAHPGLRSLYKKSKARTSTAMLSRSSDSRCSVAAKPHATGTGKSSRPRHFRREKMRRRPGEYNQIDGGLVRRLCLANLANDLYGSFHYLQVTPG